MHCGGQTNLNDSLKHIDTLFKIGKYLYEHATIEYDQIILKILLLVDSIQLIIMADKMAHNLIYHLTSIRSRIAF